MTYVKFVPTKKADRSHTNHAGTWNPPVDIIETEDDYRLELDLPGFTKDNVKISVAEGVLTVSGERKRDHDYDENYFRYFERKYGDFSRSFRLPDFVDGDKIGAEYTNGVLALTLPKKEEVKPFSIEIK